MKHLIAASLAIFLIASLTACGCQNSEVGSNTTNTSTSATEASLPPSKVTEPILDPTILDPTLETNIPDEHVNEKSTNSTAETHP